MTIQYISAKELLQKFNSVYVEPYTSEYDNGLTYADPYYFRYFNSEPGEPEKLLNCIKYFKSLGVRVDVQTSCLKRFTVYLPKQKKEVYSIEPRPFLIIGFGPEPEFTKEQAIEFGFGPEPRLEVTRSNPFWGHPYQFRGPVVKKVGEFWHFFGPRRTDLYFLKNSGYYYYSWASVKGKKVSVFTSSLHVKIEGVEKEYGVLRCHL